LNLKKDLIRNLSIHYEQKYDRCPDCGFKIVKCGTKPRIINGREVSIQYYKCNRKKGAHYFKAELV